MKGTIYKYTSPSGKVYIGQTVNSQEQRARNGEGYKGCPAFYRAIQKYGFENFIYEVLEEVEQEELDEKEKYYIALYNSLVPNGYNILTGGHDGYNPEFCKKTYQYDLEGNFIREWESLAAIERELPINKANASACCRHEKLTSDGYIWQYADDVQLEEHLVDRRSKTQKKIGACKPVLQFSKDGTFI